MLDPKPTEEQLDRERVACVFCLSGGELHVPHPDFPDDFDDHFEYWHEGAPDYVDEPLGADPDLCRTAIVNELFGRVGAPSGWRRVCSFASSGERECWWCGDGAGNEDQRDDCQLCEGDGLLYLGDGWCEVVFAPVSETYWGDGDEDEGGEV